MAWRSSGANHKSLVDNLKANGVLKNTRVYESMIKVDRANYSPNNPYEDRPQQIGYATTISAPHMHAHTLEQLTGALKEGARALDVGSGSGYLTACMAVMVGETGKALGIDHIDELIINSIKNFKKDQCTGAFVDSGRIKMVVGDGRKGYPELAPYDVIHVGGAIPEIPEALLLQLAPGGRMIVPVGPKGGNQKLMKIDKLGDGRVERTELMGVIYGSLTNKEEQWPTRR